MNIAINLFQVSPKSKTGAFVYIENLLSALAKVDAGVTYHLLGQAETIRHFKMTCRNLPNVRFRTFDIRRDLYADPLNALYKLVAKLRKDNEMRERIIAREVQDYANRAHIDVYFSPSGVIYPKGLRDVRHVTTVLDLQPEYFPENFPPSYLAERRRNAKYVVEHSEFLIAISEYTKKTLTETYGTAQEKIRVVYPAAQEIRGPAATRMLPGTFVFYPAALWPHKNHRVLIRAFSIVRDRFPNLHVVCAGPVKQKVVLRDLEQLVEAEGLFERIHFLGYVSDADIQSIYARARVLVYPSSFEGFGIPLVEAMAFGVPVIAADNSSITEVVGDAGILVPTGDASALAEAIGKVLTDARLREELVRKGRERAKLFSWDKSARETLAVFKQALKS